MKARKPLGKAKRNLVAVQFQNGIGNFVMMTPAIKALAQHFNADIDVILDKSWTDSRRKGLEEFCKIWPLVREVREFQDGFDKDDYVHLFYAQHGETSESHNYFKEHAENGAEHVNWRAGKQHEIDYYMDAVYETGYRGPVPDQHYTTRVPHNFRVETNDIKMFRVGFCNGFFAGSKWGWERKGWPYFPELANLLQRYFKGRMKIYLFGKGKRELEWAETIGGGQDRELRGQDGTAHLDVLHTVHGHIHNHGHRADAPGRRHRHADDSVVRFHVGEQERAVQQGTQDSQECPALRAVPAES